MIRIVVIFLLLISTIMAMLLALLGIETLPINPLGWFLLLVGIAYISGLGIVHLIRKERFWESSLYQVPIYEEHHNPSFWIMILGMIAVFFLSPIEFINFSEIMPRNVWVSSFGLGLVTFGVVLFIWAYRILRMNYSASVSMESVKILRQNGPYRFIRHPAYTSYLLMALGVSLGYSSITGLILLLVLVIPSLVWQVKIKDTLLTKRFGEAYLQYMSTTKQLIPGIW